MKIAVIGAGIGGLTAAYELQKLGHKIIVYEREDKPGGLAAGFKEKNWNWSMEKYYHHWFKTDHAILSLIEELGLSKKVVFLDPTTVVYHKNKFYPLDSAFAVLKFPGFSLYEKLRFGVVTAYLKYFSGWKRLERFAAVDWIKKFYGSNLYEIFFKPLLVGKFSDYFEEVNMAWFWARFKARSAKLGTYVGGFQTFLDQFTEALLSKCVQFHFDARISGIKQIKDNKLELSVGDECEIFDQVLATISPSALYKITPQLSVDYVRKIKNQKSIGAIVVILSLKHQLSKEGYYWFNLPKSAGFPFLALVEHTNYLTPKFFNNEHLVYCGDYLEANHPYFLMSDKELVNHFTPSLSRINPEFDKKWITKSWVFKTPYAQPIPSINHSNNILNIETPINGLFLASMSQVYPWDRGTNYAVSLAYQAVKLMQAVSEKS